MKWAVKARSLQVCLAYCWTQRDWGGDGESSVCFGAAGRDPCSRSQALPTQPCNSLPSPGAHDSRRQLPDLLLLHCHLLLQHWRWSPQGLPRDVRDALGPRRGELEGSSYPREARSGGLAGSFQEEVSGGVSRLAKPGLEGSTEHVALRLPQIRETRRTVRDSDSGLEQMSIGHHIRDRAHILQRSRNHRTGDQEERQDYINLDESKPPSSSSLPASCHQPLAPFS